MKKLTYTTPAILLKINFAKSYLDAIITGRVSQHFGLFRHIYEILQVFSELQQKLNNLGKKHIKNHIMRNYFVVF